MDVRATRIGWLGRLYVCATLVACVALPVGAADGPMAPVYDARDRVSLHGEWRFSLEGPGADGFWRPEFEDSEWASLPVPGNWEPHGFGEFSYRTGSEEVGLYRRWIDVPASWDGKRICAYFEGVYAGAELWVNGHRVGKHDGGYTSFGFEIDRFVRPGERNLLCLRVSKRHPTVFMDEGDYWAFGGIYRPAYLFATPRVHIADHSVVTRLSADGQWGTLEVTARLRNATDAAVECRLVGELRDADGQRAQVGESEGSVRLGPRGEGELVITASVRDVRPWTAETPYLYTLRLGLQAGGKQLQAVTTRVGFREVEVIDGQLCVNRVPVTIKGITTLDVHPELCHATTPEVWERDIRLMKQANANCIRRGWIGTPVGFLDLCDELGMYVIDEAPFSNIGERMHDRSLYGAFLQRTREMLMRDKNHPAVIVWSLGNENPYSDNHRDLIAHCRAHDPTRPVVITSQGTRPAAETTLLSWHYPGYGVLDRLHDAFYEHPEHAVLVTEYGHCLYGSGGGLEDMWPVLAGSRNCAGGTRFDWCDQGVLRPTEDGGTTMDSAGILGTDGMTGPYRELQPEYFQTKKMYSPVAVSPDRASVGSGLQSLKLTVENKQDFTNVSRLTARWVLLEDEEALQRGRLRLDAPPHGKGTYTVRVSLPAELQVHRRYRLDVAFVDGAGHEVDLHQIALTPKEGSANRAPTGTVTQRLSGDEIVLTCALRGGSIVARFDRDTGVLNALELDGQSVMEALSVSVGRPLLEHEVRHGSETILTGFPADFALETSKPRILVEPDGVGLLAQAVYTHTGAMLRQAKVAVGLHYALHSSGALEVRYGITPIVDDVPATNEVGVRIPLPPKLADVEYRGWGPWPSYPDRWAGTRMGVFGLSAEDDYWTENRSHVEWALAGSAGRTGSKLPVPHESGSPVAQGRAMLGIFGDDLNIRREQAGDQAAIVVAGSVSGIGDKFHAPRERYVLSTEGAPTYAGRVFLYPGARDGATLQRLQLSVLPQDASRDTDGDGIPDGRELRDRTNPLVADTDADGVSDKDDGTPRDPDIPEPRSLAFEDMTAKQVAGQN